MNRYESLLIAACVAGTLCVATVATAQQPAAAPKGSVALATTTVTATVTRIDQKTRAVTVKTADGQEYSFVADEAVKNLAQVKTGDVVTATYAEALAYEVKKGGTAGAVATVGGGTATPGEKPAAGLGRKITVVVVVTKIDAKAPSVTFKTPSGESRTVKVQSPEKLVGVSVGDSVEITYAEAIALKVEPKSKK